MMKTQDKFAGINLRVLSSACALCAGLFVVSSAHLDSQSLTTLAEPEVYTVYEDDFVTPRTLSYGDIQRLGQSEVFEAAAAYDVQYARVEEIPERRFSQLVKVSPGFFDVVGMRPALSKGDGTRDGVYVSESLWRRLAANQGRETDLTVGINHLRRPVLGVVPARYAIPAGTEVWVQLDESATILEPEEGRDFFGGVFKIRPSVSREKAERILNRLYSDTRQAHSEWAEEETVVRLLPLEYSPVPMERIDALYSQAPVEEPGSPTRLGAPHPRGSGVDRT